MMRSIYAVLIWLALTAVAWPAAPPQLVAYSIAELAGFNLTDAPRGLQRCGFLKAGDSPCLPFQGQAGACFQAFVGTVTTPAGTTTSQLNVTAIASGGLRVGYVMPGPIFAAGTIITSQISGSPAGIGVYQLSQGFTPPPSFQLTILGDGTTQVPSADGGCWIGTIPPSFDVSIYGVVCDGSTDNTAALNAALSQSNRFVQLPAGPGTCKFSSTLIIGNGSTTATSGVNNVFIGTTIAPVQWLSAWPQPLPTLEYTGSGIALQLNGQLSGWGIKGVRLRCDNPASTGIQAISVTGGDSRNFFIQNCKIPVQPAALATPAPGTLSASVAYNNYEHFAIELPPTSGAVGLELSVAAGGGWDEFFDTWRDGLVSFDTALAGVTRTCIYAGFGDSNLVDDVHCIIISGRADTINGVVTDYTTPNGGNVFPNSYVFNKLDIGSANPQWSVVGTRDKTQGPNYVNNIPINNGSNYPFNVSGLWPDTTQWQNWTPVASCDAGTHAGTLSAVGQVRQVRDTFEYRNTLTMTAIGTCAFYTSSTLWSATPCKNVGSQHWVGAGINNTTDAIVSADVDITQNPQLLSGRKFDNTALALATGQSYTIQGSCQSQDTP